MIESESKKDEIIKIPNHFKNALEISIKQIQSGNTISNAVVEKEIEVWLYK